MSDLWLFGYGSIIWKVDFPFVEKKTGHIRHWSRRFWQGSTDHRGLPHAPGRVVTLIDTPGSVCGGVAFKLAAETLDETLALLDYREKGGYQRINLPIYFDDGVVDGITYCADRHNPNFLGDAPLLDIAHQIARSHGPSGANKEYILNLDTALADLGFNDPHVSDVAAEVRRISDSGVEADESNTSAS